MKKYLHTLAALVMILFLTVSVIVKECYANRQHAPAKVTHLQAVQQGDGILLSWQAVAGCDSYRIYHEKGKKLHRDSFWVDIGSSQTSYLFTEVSPGKRYSFRVSAHYGKKEGRLSALVRVLMKQNTKAGPSDTGK